MTGPLEDQSIAHSGNKAPPVEETPAGEERPAAASPSAPLQAESNKVPRQPSTQPDNVCFFTDVNILGGDLSEAEGGQGVSNLDYQHHSPPSLTLVSFPHRS